METALKDKVIPAAEHLERLLHGVPAAERREKALYHLDRLKKAFLTSHQEAIRFAAFTVNKAVHDSDWGPDVAASMEALRLTLSDAGHDFLKGN
jgi:hypothetical protein